MTPVEEKNVKTYHLRLPSWLFNWLRDRAILNDHTIAQELRAILRKTHENDDPDSPAGASDDGK